MAATESSVYFIHSPSIPMTLKDPRDNSSRGLENTGHEAILEMHANSEASALFYVVVVLALYVLALVAVLAKYLRHERYDNRLTRLYDEFISRDRYTNRVAKEDQGCQAAQAQKDKKTVEAEVKEQKQSLVTNPEFVV